MLIAFYSEGRQAGKDTAATFVRGWCSLHNWEYERRAFADKMKQLVACALGLDPQDPATLETIDEFKLNGHVEWTADSAVRTAERLSGREFIINLAGDGPDTGARGLFGSTFWLDLALPLSQDWQGNWEHVDKCIAVTDLRFPEEATRVHEMGGLVVEVVNPRAESPKGRSESMLAPHSVDYRIDNTLDLDALKHNVHTLMSIIGPKGPITEEEQEGVH